jgi:hypothetical protein
MGAGAITGCAGAEDESGMGPSGAKAAVIATLTQA